MDGQAFPHLLLECFLCEAWRGMTPVDIEHDFRYVFGENKRPDVLERLFDAQESLLHVESVK